MKCFQIKYEAYWLTYSEFGYFLSCSGKFWFYFNLFGIQEENGRQNFCIAEFNVNTHSFPLLIMLLIVITDNLDHRTWIHLFWLDANVVVYVPGAGTCNKGIH